MSAPGGPPSRTGRHVATYYADIPRTRPPKPVPIDQRALDDWNEAQDRAKAAYYGTTDYYAARTAASEKARRYRARKDAS